MVGREVLGTPTQKNFPPTQSDPAGGWYNLYHETYDKNQAVEVAGDLAGEWSPWGIKIKLTRAKLSNGLFLYRVWFTGRASGKMRLVGTLLGKKRRPVSLRTRGTTTKTKKASGRDIVIRLPE